jgi:hypothetical protein
LSSRSAVRRPSAGLVLRLLAAATALAAGPALAQSDEPSEAEVGEVVVNGQRRLPGEVMGDITPELRLGPRDIRAYGAANVSELLEALAPQTASGQGGGGRPVVLIDGARVSGFAEIRDLPTEAIVRVDILPEEVSLKYGYPAEQKVVNIVLRRRFRAWLAEGSATAPTQPGGGDTAAAHGALLHILRGQRLMLDAKATGVDPILESDRHVVGRGDAAFRTLQPRSTDVVLNAVVARPLGRGVSGSLNGVFESAEGDSKLGLSPFSQAALARHSEAADGRLAASANGALAGWQWSYTGNLARNVSKSTTDRGLTTGDFTDRTRWKTTSADSDIVLNRALWRLPAGQVSTTLTGRVSTMELDSESLRMGVLQAVDLSRDIGQLQASVDVPLTRTGEGLGAAIGRLSANVNLGVQLNP